MVWKGEGRGSYAAAYKEVEHGRGEWEKVVVSQQYLSYRPKSCCLCLLALALLSVLGYLLYHLLRAHTVTSQADEVTTPGMARDAIDCETGYNNFEELWNEDKKAICCDLYGRACHHVTYHQHHVVYHPPHHYTQYNCHAGYSNWYFGWSEHKKAGLWAHDKKEWCCAHFQKGCPETTLSPEKCDTPCTLKGETSTCLSRIHWTANNVFGAKADKCALAYSKVQVECDVCRSCTIE
ncbi:unnamed protein product, partial [Symbiodinium pilosum]